MTGRADFRKSAERLIGAFSSRISTLPAAIPQMLVACEFLLSEPQQIVIVGDRDAADTGALLRTVHSRFASNRILLLVDSAETRDALAAGVPALAGMAKLQDHAAAYVCRNYTCQLPVAEPAALLELLH
jgi:hypothetical protein